MTEVRGVVTLHPKTVTKAEKLAKERRASLRQPREPDPSITRRYRKRPPWMNRQVWNEALRLADGDYRRVIVDPNSPTEALVTN